jgi:hypothetical protein
MGLIEPELVKWCIKLARMGAPLTKEQVHNLARELIAGTELETRLLEFKKKRGI